MMYSVISVAMIIFALSGTETKAKKVDCTLPADPGFCYGYFRRYYYDVKTKTCKAFVYGGCLGNSNRFFTMTSCKAQCMSGPNRVTCGGKQCSYYASCLYEKCYCRLGCPRIYDPVCGTDGKDYGNPCILRGESCKGKKWIAIAKRGRCDGGFKRPYKSHEGGRL